MAKAKKAKKKRLLIASALTGLITTREYLRSKGLVVTLATGEKIQATNGYTKIFHVGEEHKAQTWIDSQLTKWKQQEK